MPLPLALKTPHSFLLLYLFVIAGFKLQAICATSQDVFSIQSNLKKSGLNLPLLWFLLCNYELAFVILLSALWPYVFIQEGL